MIARLITLTKAIFLTEEIFFFADNSSKREKSIATKPVSL